MKKPSENLLKLVCAAVDGGAAIMEIYKGEIATTIKSDNSPVTEADVNAEAVILKALVKIDPQTPVIAEEAVAGGKEPKAYRRFYLVDPLDGTKEFISRNGEFTVNIALIEDGLPTSGVVFAPAIGRMFCGETGNGAFEAKFGVGDDLDKAIWREITVPKTPQTNLIAVASRSHRDQQTEDWLAEKGITEVVSAGSSLKFCLVAAGDAHLYPRFGRTMEWDTGAGHAVVLAAGGKVTVADGSPLEYGKEHRGFDNPAFFVSG